MRVLSNSCWLQLIKIPLGTKHPHLEMLMSHLRFRVTRLFVHRTLKVD